MMKILKDIRLKGYDYSGNGYYFVTIVCHNRQTLLTGKNQDVVAQFIGRLSEQPGVSVDYWVAMPDHIHMILVLDRCDLKLGEIIRRFKARTTHAIGEHVWQPNYYEHVIRDEKALLKIREYIQNNPKAERISFEQFYTSETPNKLGNYSR